MHVLAEEGKAVSELTKWVDLTNDISGVEDVHGHIKNDEVHLHVASIDHEFNVVIKIAAINHIVDIISDWLNILAMREKKNEVVH